MPRRKYRPGKPRHHPTGQGAKMGFALAFRVRTSSSMNILAFVGPRCMSSIPQGKQGSLFTGVRGRVILRTTSPLRSSKKFASESRASSQEGGIDVARLSDSSSSEARMIAECMLCTRLSCEADHSSITSSMAAVLTASRLASTSSLNCLCSTSAVPSIALVAYHRRVAHDHHSSSQNSS